MSVLEATLYNTEATNVLERQIKGVAHNRRSAQVFERVPSLGWNEECRESGG
jgi:hypothetical protein